MSIRRASFRREAPFAARLRADLEALASETRRNPPDDYHKQQVVGVAANKRDREEEDRTASRTWKKRTYDAITDGAVDTMRDLMKEPWFDPNEAYLFGGVTFLMYASATGRVEILRMMLGHNGFHKAILARRDDGGATALIKASMESRSSAGQLDVVRMLLEAYANIDARDVDGRTALMWASLRNNVELVQLLLENGANINAKDYLGQTAWNHAKQRGVAEDVAELLEGKGAILERWPPPPPADSSDSD